MARATLILVCGIVTAMVTLAVLSEAALASSGWPSGSQCQTSQVFKDGVAANPGPVAPYRFTASFANFGAEAALGRQVRTKASSGMNSGPQPLVLIDDNPGGPTVTFNCDWGVRATVRWRANSGSGAYMWVFQGTDGNSYYASLNATCSNSSCTTDSSTNPGSGLRVVSFQLSWSSSTAFIDHWCG